jgi:hypothetical protein
VPNTPIYALPFEQYPPDQPGITLHGGTSGLNPILAEEVENELVRIDNDISVANDDIAELQSIVQPGVGWNIFTPTIINDGTATYSTRTGRWRRIGVLTVHLIIYFVCDGDGSGGATPLNVSTSAPPINRATRQMIPLSIEGASGGGGGNRMGHLLSLTGGTSATWDRVRWQDGVDSHLDNMVGQDIDAGMIFVAQGTYQEEESP